MVYIYFVFSCFSFDEWEIEIIIVVCDVNVRLRFAYMIKLRADERLFVWYVLNDEWVFVFGFWCVFEIFYVFVYDFMVDY